MYMGSHSLMLNQSRDAPSAFMQLAVGEAPLALSHQKQITELNNKADTHTGVMFRPTTEGQTLLNNV